jgi:hypothetical protein
MYVSKAPFNEKAESQHLTATRVADGEARRALWGWSPPPLPAQTAWARRVDRFAPRTGLRCLAFLVGIVALLSIAPHLVTRGQLVVEGIAFLASGGWCALNFWRCRQAHCLISGGGWLGLSFLSFIETGLGHSVINGYEQPVFLGVLAIGVAFEGTWYLRRGDNIVRFGATGQSTAR